MGVGAISLDRDLHKKVYTWHNQMIFCCGKKRTSEYHMMKSDHRIAISKVLWEQRMFWVLSKAQDDKLQICKVQSWEIPFPAKFKKGYYDL